MKDHAFALGMIGLGTMGRNLALNIAEKGFPTAGYDRDPGKAAALAREGTGLPVKSAAAPDAFLDLLAKPRRIILLVPAGAPVDAVIKELAPRLVRGDILIDGGNSHFKDTEKRQKKLERAGIHFLGVGISGGEAGARRGPCIMPGGSKEAYESVRPIFETVAAQKDGEPCAAWLGPGGAGHFVKMVHNGIEYGLLQLIAESYDLLGRGLGLSNDDLHALYEDWNRGRLNSYLMEITAKIFTVGDAVAGGRLVDRILDKAGQKGTGKWTSQEAMDLQVPVPTIDAAVSARDLSGFWEERQKASSLMKGPGPVFQGDREAFLKQLQNGLCASFLLAYAQGLALLAQASTIHRYALELETVARIWREGCIIRSALLEEIRAAYREKPDLPNLLLDPRLAGEAVKLRGDLEAVVRTASVLGLPAPAFMASLAYLDGFRSARLPANLIQAQRDFFGAHTYERRDSPGAFHTDWEKA